MYRLYFSFNLFQKNILNCKYNFGGYIKIIKLNPPHLTLRKPFCNVKKSLSHLTKTLPKSKKTSPSKSENAKPPSHATQATNSTQPSTAKRKTHTCATLLI